MAALVAALNSPPIRRLKRSWDQVHGRYITMLDEIENLMQVCTSIRWRRGPSLTLRVRPVKACLTTVPCFLK